MTEPHRKRWIRIQGVALVMFVMSQVDRSDIVDTGTDLSAAMASLVR